MRLHVDTAAAKAAETLAHRRLDEIANEITALRLDVLWEDEVPVEDQLVPVGKESAVVSTHACVLRKDEDQLLPSISGISASVAIKMHSDAIKGTQRPLRGGSEALRCNQGHSEEDQKHSEEDQSC